MSFTEPLDAIIGERSNSDYSTAAAKTTTNQYNIKIIATSEAHDKNTDSYALLLFLKADKVLEGVTATYKATLADGTKIHFTSDAPFTINTVPGDMKHPDATMTIPDYRELMAKMAISKPKSISLSFTQKMGIFGLRSKTIYSVSAT